MKNEPAFPTEYKYDPVTMEATDAPTGDPFHWKSLGLSKREWFAGMALQGMISKHGFDSNYTEGNANEAFRIADAMIKESEKKQP